MNRKEQANCEALQIFRPSLRAPSPEIHRCPCCDSELDEFGEAITWDLEALDRLSDEEVDELG